jgi:hypothetical protein
VGSDAAELVPAVVHRHASADVDVHSTEELEEAVSARITGRCQLQWWPLSSVELLTLDSGLQLVYKAQRLLVTEPAFYRAAGCRTKRLPQVRVLTEDDGGSTMLIEYLGRPVSLADAQPADVVALASRVVGEIGALPQHLPVYLDISTADRWVTEVEEVLGRLTKLVETAQFSLVSGDDISFARDWAQGPGIHELVESNSRLANGDMKFDHVFCGPAGFRFVDWSVPVRGPAEIDLVQLLEEQDIDPLDHVHPDLVVLRWFLFLRWAIEGKTRLLPAIPTMFDEWAAKAVAQMRAAVRGRTRRAGHGSGSDR